MRTLVVGLALLVAMAGRAEADGRAAKIAAVVSWIAAGVATAVGVAAFVEKDAYQDRAHRDLLALTQRNAGSFSDGTNLAFYAKPTCSPPPSVYQVDAAGALKYASDCRAGESWTNTATAMVVIAPALAVGGGVMYAMGAKQAERQRNRLHVSLLPTGLRVTF